jgi:hypothetical protein
VAVDPWLVTTVTVVSEIGTVVVVVPPFEVRMDETTGDEATVTVWVAPLEVTTETVDGDGDGAYEMDETNDEVAEAGRVDPDSTTTGELQDGAGVSTVSVDPYGVVTVTVSGDGR